MRRTTVAALGVAALLVVLDGGSVRRAAASEPAAEAISEQIRFHSSAGEVLFPHRMHAEDLGMECGECHHETEAAVLEVPHQDYFADLWVRCESCHHPGGTRVTPQPCDSCHRASVADAADETLSAKVVIHQSCWSCHEVGTGAEASGACASCHTPAETEAEAAEEAP